MNHICSECIGEPYLKRLIASEGYDATCDYCEEDDDEKCYAIEELANLVELAFETHYERTSNQPDSWQDMLLRDRESNYEWEREGEEIVNVLAAALDIDEEIAHEIQQILEDRHSDQEMAQMGEETEFSSDAHYQERGVSSQSWDRQWGRLKQSLKTENRFFNRSAESFFESLFEGIDHLRTSSGLPLIVEAGPNTERSSLYRARSFETDDALMRALERPDIHLGPPPTEVATAGRMNAHGVSVFYGANTDQAALAEIRPTVGSHVAVARFEITQPVRLLDLSSISGTAPQTGSIFDPNYIDELGRIHFLKGLGARICQPVTPYHERFEYLATQAFAEYLSNATNLNIDGIIYPSVQSSGDSVNYVLMPPKSRVAELDLTNISTIEARRYCVEPDTGEIEYSVSETQANTQKSSPMISGGQSTQVLTVDANSIVVHKVNSVEVKSVKFEVNRHRDNPADLDWMK